jgi:hypothetical protein
MMFANAPLGRNADCGVADDVADTWVLEYFLRSRDTLGFSVDATFAYPKAVHTLPHGELDPTGSHAGAFDDLFLEASSNRSPVGLPRESPSRQSIAFFSNRIRHAGAPRPHGGRRARRRIGCGLMLHFGIQLDT